MIISKLTIYNFRSYYGMKVFTFSNSLNLILGSNGDGKTTFFEALNWVLTPDYAPRGEDEKMPEDKSLVSAKMFSELRVGDMGRVMVQMEIKNNSGHPRIIERAFNVYKTSDGDMRIEARIHKAYQQVGMRRKEYVSIKDLFEKENVFPAIIKKYHVFKGEDKLNIFNDKTTLQTLIDMFSEIKDLDPYEDFSTYALDISNKAMATSNDKTNKQNAKALSLQKDITQLTRQLERYEHDLQIAKNAYNTASKQIEAIESDYEIIQSAAKLEDEITSLEREIERLSSKIDEEYSIKLLDEQWILMGFESVLKEYNGKMDSLMCSKNNIENDFLKKQEADFNSKKIEKAKTELEKVAWNLSDVDKMKYMLKTNRCLYCGNEVPDGSVSYDFIKQRIIDVLDLLEPKEHDIKPEYKRYFSGRNVENLKEIGLSLLHAGKDINGIQDEIENKINGNAEIKAAIKSRELKINSIKKQIFALYASSSTGENLKEYVTNISVVNRWHEEKQNSAVSMDRLSRTIRELQEQIRQKRENLTRDTKNNKGDSMFMVNEFFRLFQIAVENTQATTYQDFLDKLSGEANLFLTQLNVDDFTGIIKIYLDRFKDLKIELQDRHGQTITNPNTSLLTTMHISILFAISELTKENRNAEYPLIFDAPTSSFDEGKDKTFYECLNSQVNKQCIVVTKSYLYKNDDGEFVTDEIGLSKLQCKKYRIRKLTGFDKLDINTIETQVEEL